MPTRGARICRFGLLVASPARYRAASLAKASTQCEIWQMRPLEDVERIVRIVADARQASRPDGEIIEELLAAGIEPQRAAPVLATVTEGLQAGVTAGVTDGASVADAPDDSPLFDAAVREGQHRFRGAVRRVRLQRIIWLAVIALAVAALTYFLFR